MTHVNLEIAQLPEADRLADLAGVQTDLKACRAYCQTQLQRQPIKDDFAAEVTAIGALTVAAFVSYGRCFKSGVRAATGRDLEASIHGVDRVHHKMIIDLRDKFVAHSVNDLESHRLRIWMFPQGSSNAIWAVTIESDHMVTPPSAIFETVIALCDKHIAWVEAETEKESQKLKALLEDRYSPAEIYAFGRTASPPLNFTKLNKGRKPRKH